MVSCSNLVTNYKAMSLVTDVNQAAVSVVSQVAITVASAVPLHCNTLSPWFAEQAKHFWHQDKALNPDIHALVHLTEKAQRTYFPSAAIVLLFGYQTGTSGDVCQSRLSPHPQACSITSDKRMHSVLTAVQVSAAVK